MESRWYDGGVIEPFADVCYTTADVVVDVLEAQNYEGPLVMSDCPHYFDTFVNQMKSEELMALVRPLREENGNYGYSSIGLAALDAYQVIVKALSQCSQPSDLTKAINGTSLEGFTGSFSFDENGQAVYNTVSYWHDGEWKNYKYRAMAGD